MQVAGIPYKRSTRLYTLPPSKNHPSKSTAPTIEQATITTAGSTDVAKDVPPPEAEPVGLRHLIFLTDQPSTISWLFSHRKQHSFSSLDACLSSDRLFIRSTTSKYRKCKSLFMQMMGRSVSSHFASSTNFHSDIFAFQESECTERDGWLLPGTLDKCRKIISDDVRKTLDKKHGMLTFDLKQLLCLQTWIILVMIVFWPLGKPPEIKSPPDADEDSPSKEASSQADDEMDGSEWSLNQETAMDEENEENNDMESELLEFASMSSDAWWWWVSCMCHDCYFWKASRDRWLHAVASVSAAAFCWAQCQLSGSHVPAPAIVDHQWLSRSDTVHDELITVVAFHWVLYWVWRAVQ